MTNMWVMAPDERPPSAEMQALAAALQAEIAAIEALGHEDACRLCGTRALMSKEHTPAKKAGNPGRVISATIDAVRSIATGWISWTTRKVQTVAVPTLCRSCNNNTGSWYNPAYIRLAQCCDALATKGNAGRVCTVDLEVHPQRVAKQALTSIIATSQPGLTARYPLLRELLTNKEGAGSIAPVRLWLYLRANRGLRRTGLVPAVLVAHRVGQILAEFSSWPLGWVATFGNIPVDGAVDVSQWTEVGFHEKKRVQIGVPCQWAVYAYPADFRPPEAFAR